MNPGGVFFCEWDEGGEVVEGAEVEVAGLKDDDGGCCWFGFECLLERFFGEAAVGVGGECGDVFFAEAEKPRESSCFATSAPVSGSRYSIAAEKA